MTSALYVVMLCLASVAWRCQGVPAAQRKTSIENTIEKIAKTNRCLFQAESCNPLQDTCCPGMQCRNLMRGHCVFGLETCICLPAKVYDNHYNTYRFH